MFKIFGNIDTAFRHGLAVFYPKLAVYKVLKSVITIAVSVAVNRRFAKDNSQQQTDFFNVTAWRATADFVSKYFKKGSSIFVIGTLQNRSWTDQNGQKRYATDIVAEEVSFVDSRSESSSSGQYVPDSYNAEPSFSGGAEAPKFEEIKGDDDLPF